MITLSPSLSLSLSLLVFVRSYAQSSVRSPPQTFLVLDISRGEFQFETAMEIILVADDSSSY